jgi:3-oxoacyl-[acyl-carrier-protein] synthase II
MSDLPVLSGIGHVGPSGCGVENLRGDLAASRPRLSEVDRSADYHHGNSSRLSSQVGSPDLTTWVPARAARRMSFPSRWCLAAARMALEDALLPLDKSLGDRTGAILGTAFGTTAFTEALLKEILLDGPQAASPFYFAETVANAPTAQMAIGTGATGTNETVTQREVGDLVSLGRAAAELRRGRCDRVLAGVYDEIHPLIHAYLDRYRALARPIGDDDELARPFDRRRNGFITAEGATVVVVEKESAAQERGARILARIRGAGEAFDPSAPGHGWGVGEQGLARGLHRMLDRARVAVSDIDLIISGASGSIDGDRIEAGILRRLAPTLPPIVAPRGVTGVFGGAFLAAAILIAGGAKTGSTVGFSVADSELGISPHDGSELEPPSLSLISTPAAGGAAAWLLLERA